MRFFRNSLRAIVRPFARIRERFSAGSAEYSTGGGALAGAGYGIGVVRTVTAPGWRKLVRWLVVAFGFAAYFALQLVLAYLCNQLLWIYIVAFMIIIACLVFAAAKPTATYIFWLAFSPLGFLFLRMDFGSSIPTISFDRVAIVALAGFLIFKTLLYRHRIKRPITGEALTLLHVAYIAIALYVMHPGSLREILRTLAEKFDHIALALTAYYIAKSVLTNRKQLLGAVIALIVTGGYCALSAFYEHFTGLRWFSSFLPVESRLGYADVGRACGPLINPSALGTFLGITAFLTYHLYYNVQRRSLKTFLLALMLLQLIGCYFTYTRGGYIAPAMLLLLMPFFARAHRKYYVALLVGAVVAVIIAAPIVASNKQIHRRLTKQSTMLGRVVITAGTMNIVKHHPFFGIGLGQIDYGLEKYITNAGTLSGWYARGMQPLQIYPQKRLYPVITSHNSFLTILAEEGLVGGFLYFGSFMAFIVHLFRVRARLPDDGIMGKDLIALLIVAGMGHFASTLTYDIRFFKYPNYVLWAMFAIGVRLGEIANEEARVAKDADVKGDRGKTPVLTHG